MSSGLKEQKSKTERPDRIRKVSDARVLPKFIMFDGEGNYQRKIINDHRNKDEQIEFTWAKSLNSLSDTDRYDKIGAVGPIKDSRDNLSTTNLPTISFNRKVLLEEKIQLRPQISTQTLVKYGKYSLRYNESSDIYRLQDETKKNNIQKGYDAASGAYGQFYYENDTRPKFTGQVSVDLQLPQVDTPTSPNVYRVYEVEKPVLTYHSLKSYLFQNAKKK